MKESDSVEQSAMNTAPRVSSSPLRPLHTSGVNLEAVAKLADAKSVKGIAAEGVAVTGVSLDSRSVQTGDLYIGLPGAHIHGARFARQAVAAGALAILTDAEGSALLDESLGVPVLVSSDPRAVTGRIAALIYGTNLADASNAFELYAVTGTNGKTTTTYFVNSLLRALGKSTGLIGTIEILAGDEPIPSRLTTPESTDIHSLLALMRERRLDAASMEVSSHALAFGRVDSVTFDMAAFTNLTQDHLDLHGDMEGYFQTKAQLFTPAHAKQAVVVIDDLWGQKLAATATIPVTTLATKDQSVPADWSVSNILRAGVGNSFHLSGPNGLTLKVQTGLPGEFNVSNAALATIMVAQQLLQGASASASAASPEQQMRTLQLALDQYDPFTLDVPGRMQLLGTAPVAVVDFAHNPDALERAIDAVRNPEAGSRVIVVFGATGERDVSKRPIMGAIAAQRADVVLITDDDPHDEDPAQIRADVLAGARAAKKKAGLEVLIEEQPERSRAIYRAVEVATSNDTILVAGRGHEVFQEVKGVNVSLDDRVELRTALTQRGFPVTNTGRVGF